MRKLKLFYNNQNEELCNLVKEIQDKIYEHGLIIDEKEFELAVAVGGDGSFLRMVRECGFDSNIYYIGINAGTLGFAQEIYPDEIDTFLENIVVSKYKIEDIGIISAVITTKDNEFNFKALNEVLISNKEPDTTYLNICVNDELLESFVGDAVLISTSFGSTAHNLSYGGSIVYSELATMQITPVGAIPVNVWHVLKNSVVVPDNKIIKVSPDYRTKNLNISIDGVLYTYDDVCNIEHAVNNKIKVLRMHDFDYTKRIHDKLL